MTGQLDPISRISLHVDTDNDGVYDKHTVFVDHLVFPRFVTPFGPNAILTKESNAQEVWKYTDTNGDGVADKKELFDTGYGRLGNIEGQESVPDLDARQLDVQHLQRVPRALDAARRHQGADRQQRRRVGRDAGQRRQDVVRERRARRAGQLPVPDRLRQLHASPDELEPDFRIPWGAPVRVADMQGGLNATRMPDGSLQERHRRAPATTSIAAHRLPKDLHRRLPLRRAGRAHRPPRSTRRRGKASPTSTTSIRTTSSSSRSTRCSVRSIVTTAPDGTRVHHGHVSRHHPGRELRRTGHLPARAHPAVRPRQDHSQGPHLAARLRRREARSVRRAAARPRRAAHEQRDAGAARHAPRPPERLVARHRAAAARAQAGQVGRAALVSR